MTTSTEHDVERYAEVDLYAVLYLTAEASIDLIERAYRLRMGQVLRHLPILWQARTPAAGKLALAGRLGTWA
jgi:hypothetical protein